MNISVNDEGDIYLDPTTNNLAMCEGTEEIRQCMIANLETIQGEWFLDTSIGIPWFTEILEKNVSLNKIDSTIIQEMATSEGVISVLTYNSSVDEKNRTLTIDAQMETVAGILDFNQTF